MKIETPKFTVQYEDIELVFKYGTDRDVVEIVDRQHKGFLQLKQYLQSRLVEVRNLEIDGKAATPDDILDLPEDALLAISAEWVQACVNFRSNKLNEDAKKKSSESEPVSA